jgi:NADH:ubiquinone oxidoreductase subunit 4 (subunit M)
MPRFGIHYHVAIDGISLWLVMLTVFITPIAAYASFGSIHVAHQGLVLRAPAPRGRDDGRFVSLDLFLFYVFWELMLIPMYVMIGVWGGTNRIRSAIKFFLYTMFGSHADARRHPVRGVRVRRSERRAAELRLLRSAAPGAPAHLQLWFLGAFTLAFVIKVPMFPSTRGSRRAHGGAHGGLHHPGRRHAQDGDVRVPALLDGALPRGELEFAPTWRASRCWAASSTARSARGSRRT